MTTRDSVLELIREHPKGMSYRLLQSGLKLERAELDPVLLGLVSTHKIRYTVTGYLAVDEAKEAATYGSAIPMRTMPPIQEGHTKKCRVCKEVKTPEEFYTGLSECKGCTSKRSAANRRSRRTGQMEKLVNALIHIANCEECCERHRQIAELAIGDTDA